MSNSNIFTINLFCPSNCKEGLGLGLGGTNDYTSAWWCLGIYLTLYELK